MTRAAALLHRPAADRFGAVATAVATAVALSAAPTLAQDVADVSASGAAVSRVIAHGDNQNGEDVDDDFVLLQERADLAVDAGDLRLQTRLDSDLFFDAPDDAYRSGLALERVSLQWSTGDFTFAAGDFAAQLGSGLALSLRRVPEVGADLALRGGRVDYQGERVAMSALIGLTNPADLDAISLRHVEAPDDLVAGGELRLLPADRVDLGALASLVLPRERLLPQRMDWTLTTGSFVRLDELLGVASARLEVDVQERALAGVSRHGAAAFADSVVRLGDAALLLEALWLSDFEVKGSRNTATGARFDYNQPPTLERIDQDVQNSRDVLGGRAGVEVPLADFAVLSASQMLRVGELRSASAVVQSHGMLSLEVHGGGAHGTLTTGVRGERLGVDKLAMLRDMVHVDSDALVPLGRGFDLHSATSLQLWRTPAQPFARGTTLLALDRREVGSVAVELGLDTQDPSTRVRHLFLAAIATWQLTPDVTLRAITGSQRGGIQCVGGVCRQLPAFAGGRAELDARF